MPSVAAARLPAAAAAAGSAPGAGARGCTWSEGHGLPTGGRRPGTTSAGSGVGAAQLSLQRSPSPAAERQRAAAGTAAQGGSSSGSRTSRSVSAPRSWLAGDAHSSARCLLSHGPRVARVQQPVGVAAAADAAPGPVPGMRRCASLATHTASSSSNSSSSNSSSNSSNSSSSSSNGAIPGRARIVTGGVHASARAVQPQGSGVGGHRRASSLSVLLQSAAAASAQQQPGLLQELCRGVPAAATAAHARSTAALGASSSRPRAGGDGGGGSSGGASSMPASPLHATSYLVKLHYQRSAQHSAVQQAAAVAPLHTSKDGAAGASRIQLALHRLTRSHSSYSSHSSSRSDSSSSEVLAAAGRASTAPSAGGVAGQLERCGAVLGGRLSEPQTPPTAAGMRAGTSALRSQWDSLAQWADGSSPPQQQPCTSAGRRGCGAGERLHIPAAPAAECAVLPSKPSLWRSAAPCQQQQQQQPGLVYSPPQAQHPLYCPEWYRHQELVRQPSSPLAPDTPGVPGCSEAAAAAGVVQRQRVSSTGSVYHSASSTQSGLGSGSGSSAAGSSGGISGSSSGISGSGRPRLQHNSCSGPSSPALHQRGSIDGPLTWAAPEPLVEPAAGTSGLSRLARSSSSSTGGSSGTASFLIGTWPAAELLCDEALELQDGSPDADGRSIRPSVCGSSGNRDQQRQRQQAESMAAEVGAVADAAAFLPGGGFSSGTSSRARSLAAAALSAVGFGHRLGSGAAGDSSSNGSSTQLAGGEQQQPACSWRASRAPDSDEVSEMSSSLEVGCSSSSGSGSDSDGGSATSAAGATSTQAAANYRRLVGCTAALTSSISCSTDPELDRPSSSCGSRHELEQLCSGGGSAPLQLLPSSDVQLQLLPHACVGLANLGNTCFANSILQCLACLPELVWALLGPKLAQHGHGPCAASGVPWSSKARVGPALCELLADMHSLAQPPLRQQQQEPGQGQAPPARRQRVVSPRRFLRRLAEEVGHEQWGDGCQHDSQEFVIALLQLLQAECNRVVGQPRYKELSGKGSEVAQAAEAAANARAWNDSLIDDLFGGLLQSTVTCSRCGAASHTFEAVVGDLTVPIPRGARAVSLQDCLRAFFDQELLTGSEAFKCGACKAAGQAEPCDATKRLRLFAWPRLLVLALKRFSSGGGAAGAGAARASPSSSSAGSLPSPLGWGGGGGGFCSLAKTNTPLSLDAAQLLDLAPFCNPAGLAAALAAGRPPPRYRLAAVSEHSGCLGGGHYSARGRCWRDGRWYEFNDASVAETAPPAGLSSAPYVLFFRLVDGGGRE